MPSLWSHAPIVLDIVSMKVFLWVLGRLFAWPVDPNGGILDSHLFFYDRYSELAEHYRVGGRTAEADRLAAIAEAYYQAASDDDDEPAAAMAMPVPRRAIRTNAVSTTPVRKPPADEPGQSVLFGENQGTSAATARPEVIACAQAFIGIETPGMPRGVRAVQFGTAPNRG